MLRAVSVTDIGKKRQLNQDYIYASVAAVGKLPNLFMVADGMGGHNAGDYASRFTIESIEKYVQNSDEADPDNVFDEAVPIVNRDLRRIAASDKELSGMGTTLVAACVQDDMLRVANVGDSRLYIVNPRYITQITVDHSLVEEMIQKGGLDRKDARNHPDKNIITRAVGALDHIEADHFCVELQKEDTILLCSDGLTNMVDDEEIKRIVAGKGTLAERADALIEAANNNGGKDNIAVILIEPFANEVEE